MKRIVSDYDEWYYGQEEAAKYGDKVVKALAGKTVSKLKATANEPGGLIYEAKQLGIDMWDLLKVLEGLCYQGKAREIDDSTYKILASVSAATEPAKRIEFFSVSGNRTDSFDEAAFIFIPDKSAFNEFLDDDSVCDKFSSMNFHEWWYYDRYSYQPVDEYLVTAISNHLGM